MASPVKTCVTPNGMRLAHYEKPWWAYTVALHEDQENFGHPWTHEEPWGRTPSVTGVNGVLDKSRPLMHYAANATYEACDHLVRTYGLPPAQHADNGSQTLKRTAQHYELDFDSRTAEAAFRGSAVHLIAENWIKHGTFPVLAEYPPHWHGYIRGMAGFLGSWKGEFLMSEQIVGSARYGYAGTCDTVGVGTAVDGLRARLDFKSSRQVYARTHFRQLEAYEAAAVEGGEDPTDKRGIVCLYESGEFEVVYVPPEHMGPREFLNVLTVWRDEQPLKKLEDAAYRQRLARERNA